MALQAVERKWMQTGEKRQSRVSSPHSRRLHLQDKIGKALLWTAAGLTMGVLIIIVGYIIVNGVYERATDDSSFLPMVENRIPIGDDPADEISMSIIVHRGLRVRNLKYDQLKELYLGLTPFWGYITGQNRNTTLYCYDDGRFAVSAAEFLLGDGKRFGKSVKTIDDMERLIQAVKQDRGAMALVPSETAKQVRGVRFVGLRQMVMAIHPGVVALQAGKRLRTLTFKQVTSLVTGAADSWARVGGPSMEIEPGVFEPLTPVPVLFSQQMPVQHELIRKIGSTGNPRNGTIRVDSLDQFKSAVTETPGAFGFIRAGEAAALGLKTAEIRYVTHRVNLRPSFLFEPPSRAGAVGGVSYIIINTLAMVLFVLLIATPIGVAGAVYIVEYAPQGTLLNVLKLGTDTLAGIPSIIFGLFGLVFFSQFLGLQTGLLSGTLTLTMMILPTIVRTCEEALRSVPRDLREGSLSLGATKHQTIMRVVLPVATPGILTGVILGIGRAVGETAAILFTMGSNMALLRSFNSPVRVLSVHLYMLIRENISIPKAFATATILVIIVFVVNFSIRHIIRRMNKIGRIPEY